MKDTKRIIVNQIKNKITSRVGSSEACRIADEPLNALAYACTFRASRHFATIDMTPQTWSELADTVTVSELMSVQSSLDKYKPSGNRLFYILACFARIYANRVPRVTSRRTDHKERSYSKAELQRLVRNMGTFSEADL